MQGYADALEECRTAEVPQRDYQELRAEFFLTAVRYGWKIFPNTVEFVEGVRHTINFLVSLKDEKAIMGQLRPQIKACEEHKRQGEVLEEKHNFVAGKLLNLQVKCMNKTGDLTDDQQNCIEEAVRLRRPWRQLLKLFLKGSDETAKNHLEEAAALGVAVQYIGKLHMCCMKVLEVIKFINTILGKIISEIAATAKGLKNLGNYKVEDGAQNRTEYFRYILLGMQKFAQRLDEFQESKVDYKATLTAIEQKDLPSKANEAEWDSDFKRHLERAKAVAQDSSC
jgi:hypothetical protein